MLIGSYAEGILELVSVSASRYGDTHPTEDALSKVVAITHSRLGSSVS